MPESGAGLAQLVEPPAGGEPQQPPHHDCFLALIPGLLEVRFWQQLKSLPKPPDAMGQLFKLPGARGSQLEAAKEGGKDNKTGGAT